jgi:hypothetical protein
VGLSWGRNGEFENVNPNRWQTSISASEVFRFVFGAVVELQGLFLRRPTSGVRNRRDTTAEEFGGTES